MSPHSFPRSTSSALKFLLFTILAAAFTLSGSLLFMVSGDGNTIGIAAAATTGTVQPITAGHYHSLEIAPGDSSLFACGYNVKGQLGTGDTETQLSLTEVPSPNTWQTVSARGNTSLAISTDGKLWGWGDNYHGQLGLGDTTNRSVPTRVGTATNWVAVASGLNFTLALRSDGTLWAWGRNLYGEVGIGETGTVLSPTRVGTATNWVAIAAGDGQALGLQSNGTLWAWGSNRYGELGLGDYENRYSPTRVGSDSNWSAVAAGLHHSMAIRSDGTLWAWGANMYGQLGFGYSSPVCQNTPKQAGTYTNWLRLAGGEWYSLGIRSDGTLWSWGLNDYGQLGLGDTINRDQPSRVGTTTDWSAVAAGRAHSLGLRSNGTLWSWGLNMFGGLGLGDTVDRAVPTQVGVSSPPPTSPPTVNTSSATYVTTTSARLNGSLTSLGTAATVNVSFQYGTVSGSYASETSAQARTSTGTFYFNLSGLNPGTTYYFRAKAVGDGTSYGSQMSFTTGAASTTPPAVSTSSASSVTTGSARLVGSLSSLGTATTVNVSFQYGTVSGSYTSETTAQARTSTGTFYCDISGLNPGTTYYFRAKAVGDGTSYGSQLSFATDASSTAPPSASTLEASNVSGTSARLNGNLTSLGSAEKVWVSFCYGTESDSYSAGTIWQSFTSTGAFYSDLTDLNPGTTYYFRARAYGDGLTYGNEMTFTTGSGATTPPSVSTSSATYVTTSSARLNGSLSSLGTAAAVNVSFQWGTVSGSYTNETTVQARTSTGTFYYNLFDLNPGTTYYYRAKAVGDGTSYGAQMTFTTGATSTAPPSVSTVSANYVTASSARMNGSLSSLGTATTVNVSFQYGTVSGSYANESTVQARTSTGSFYFNLSGLNPGTTYYFRAKAVGDGTSYGSQMSFTTETASGSQDTTPPSVTVLAPNGKEKVKAYSSTDIQWTALDNVGVTSVDIYYSIDGGSTYDAIALGESNDGVYAWTVPDTSSPKCVVKVVATDAAGNVGEDMSDGTFQIQTSKEDTLSTTAKAGIAAAGMGLIGITALAAKKRLR